MGPWDSDLQRLLLAHRAFRRQGHDEAIDARVRASLNQRRFLEEALIGKQMSPARLMVSD